MKTQKRRLMWHGMLLFLLGLITGLLEQRAVTGESSQNRSITADH